MEKRLLTFWLLTGLVFMMYFQYQARVAQQRKEAQQQQQAAQQGDVPPEGGADLHDESAASDVGDGATDAAALPEVTELPVDGPRAEVPSEVEHIALGSLDPESDYRMAVYFSSRGASVERIELNGPAYSDLGDKSGYLGYLALEDTLEGPPRIGVVAAGSPAAAAVPRQASIPAGLQPGDRLLRVDGQGVTSDRDISYLLRSRDPGETIEVNVARPVDGGRQELAFDVTLDVRPMAVIRTDRGPREPQAIGPGPESFRVALLKCGPLSASYGADEISKLPSLATGLWEVEVLDNHTVEFRRELAPGDLAAAGITGAWKFIKRYQLAKRSTDDDQPDYHIDLHVEVVNQSDNVDSCALRVDGASGLPTEGWWYTYKTHPRAWGSAGTRDVIYREPGGQHQMLTATNIVDQATDDNDNRDLAFVGSGLGKLEYVGVDTQYFAVVMLDTSRQASSGFPFQNGVARLAEPIDEKQKRLANVSFRFDTPEQQIGAGESWSQDFRIYAGPKESNILSHYGLRDCIVFGWFSFVAKPMTSLLHGLYWLVGNYGLAIVMLTVIVRGCMFPLSRYQVENAKRMQELGPEMQAIAKKFKDDMEQRAKAQRELFQKHKINPLSGCLPAMLQLPIFIGLYRSLSVDISLRGAPLIPGIPWASNLAAPDQLLNWENTLPQALAGPTGWLGPFLNVLPLISAALFLVQQKLFTPPPADEQQEIQQKMMSFMTLFMGFLFFKVPSGLCLYFISSSLWGLAERKLLPLLAKTKKRVDGGGGPAPNLPRPVTKPPANPNANALQEAATKWMGKGDEWVAETAEQRKKRRRSKRR